MQEAPKPQSVFAREEPGQCLSHSGGVSGSGQGTAWGGMEEEMGVPDGAWCQSSFCLWAAVPGIRAGAVRALQSCGSLALTHNHHEMVLGCPGRGSAGTWQVLWFQITEEHRHEVTTDKTLQKYPWPGPERKQLHAHSQCSPRVKA